MYKRSETFLNGHHANQLFLQKWTTENAVGTLLITHGQAEHSECYSHFVKGIDGSGWNIIAWDLRGHGKSEGLRGYVRDFDDYVLDFRIIVEYCSQLSEVKNKPLVLVAHSMGGLIQTCGLSEKRFPDVTAQVLSSPLFGISIDVPEWKDKGATLVNTLFPKLTLSNEIKNEDLTRDIEIMREFEQDTYRHGRISSGAYLGYKREFKKNISRAQSISLPTLLHISDKDPVVSSASALEFFDALNTKNKSLKIVEGGKHELYNDIVRLEVYKVVVDFLTQFKSQKTG